jgi:hypothetical protein
LALQDVGAEMGGEGGGGGVGEEVWWFCHGLLVVMMVGKGGWDRLGGYLIKAVRGVS